LQVYITRLFAEKFALSIRAAHHYSQSSDVTANVDDVLVQRSCKACLFNVPHI